MWRDPVVIGGDVLRFGGVHSIVVTGEVAETNGAKEKDCSRHSKKPEAEAAGHHEV
jgi:hypothetical protein